jgi:hypothetical protein
MPPQVLSATINRLANDKLLEVILHLVVVNIQLLPKQSAKNLINLCRKLSLESLHQPMLNQKTYSQNSPKLSLY